MALEKEMETYNANLSELMAHEGKFVLICGDKIHGTYTSFKDALQEGYQTFGLTPFLIKQIEKIEHIQTITRLLG